MVNSGNARRRGGVFVRRALSALHHPPVDLHDALCGLGIKQDRIIVADRFLSGPADKSRAVRVHQEVAAVEILDEDPLGNAFDHRMQEVMAITEFQLCSLAFGDVPEDAQVQPG